MTWTVRPMASDGLSPRGRRWVGVEIARAEGEAAGATVRTTADAAVAQILINKQLRKQIA